MRRRKEERRDPGCEHHGCGRADAETRTGSRGRRQRREQQEERVLLREHGQTEERPRGDPLPFQDQGHGAEGEPEADDVLGVEQLHDRAARGGQDDQEGQQGRLAAGRGRAGGPQQREAAHGEDEPAGHPEDPLCPVPRRQWRAEHTTDRAVRGPTLGHVLVERGVVAVRGQLMQVGGAARRRAPRGRSDRGTEQSDQRRGHQGVTRGVRQLVVGRCGMESTRGQVGGDRRQRGRVPTRRGTLTDGDDPEVARRSGEQEKEAAHHRPHRAPPRGSATRNGG